ncbi:hypothetical protein BFJ65_g17783 [Fusarium oxysporum f. sp. cepae]|uniref:Glutathione S-transferase UstS-like C-terminal domain-containing protein n=1 Tax=Fusarium oxysporum f. sp. cepae TaxID=396571 RepID=A0A3L6MRZ2_FUSOX|nr:hypothetical protein BFJ65_g17783 [Fusarium oxysporum f. sp. cepae]
MHMQPDLFSTTSIFLTRQNGWNGMKFALALENVPDSREDGPHTVSTIGLPNGQGWVTDSRIIADELERLYPEPSLHLQSPCLVQVENAFFNLLSASSGFWLPELPSKVMKPEVAAEWLAHGESVIGMTMQEFKASRGGKSAWREAQPIIKDMTDLLEDNSDGPFFMGTTVSYADFIWASLLIFLEFLMGTACLEKLLELGGNAAKHHDLLGAVHPWM